MKNLRLSNFMKFAFIIIFFMIITKEVRAIPNSGPELPPEAPEPNYKYDGLLEQRIPVFCGITEFVLDSSSKVMGESQVAVGQIRKNGQEFGELLGILSFGHNAERNSGSFIMTMPGLGPDGSNVSCILGYGLDWQFFYHDGTRIPQEDSL